MQKNFTDSRIACLMHPWNIFSWPMKPAREFEHVLQTSNGHITAHSFSLASESSILKLDDGFPKVLEG